MQEIRFHGRGGQGTVVASVILAKAFFKAGFFVQSFPLFGVERRGAPVEAYLRTARRKILIRSNLYQPDHVVVQDAKLLMTVDVTQGLKLGGIIMLNTSKPPKNFDAFKDFRLICLDANQIAIKYGLGTRTHPIINTVMIGGFAKIMDALSMEFILPAIQEEITIKTDANLMAAQAAFDTIIL